jgi:pimeloyl-ACP methyl ester carboxylesterase
VLAFSLLMRWPGERWRVSQGLDDWIFARDYMLRRRRDVEARAEAFADRLVARARRADADEIIVAGHSLGATIVVDMLARALARDADLGRHGPKLGVLTIGATIPKLALHPGGGWVRDAARRIAAEPSLAWAEFQARDDVISFHKFHPVELKRFNDVNDASPPVIRRVQIHEMLSEAAFRRYRFDFMRLHYQFVMANERRALYDYFMLICGPAPFRRTINQANGPVDLYAADGSLRDPAIAS